MKLKTLITISYIVLLTQTSCNKHPYQSVPENNWTQEEKDKILTDLKPMLDFLPQPEISKNENEIIQRTINECIIMYPNWEDFNKRNSMNQCESLALSKILIEYMPQYKKPD